LDLSFIFSSFDCDIFDKKADAIALRFPQRALHQAIPTSGITYVCILALTASSIFPRLVSSSLGVFLYKILAIAFVCRWRSLALANRVLFALLDSLHYLDLLSLIISRL
jgi:hypothetical protein